MSELARLAVAFLVGAACGLAAGWVARQCGVGWPWHVLVAAAAGGLAVMLLNTSGFWRWADG